MVHFSAARPCLIFAVSTLLLVLKMDTLPADQQEALRKASTDRLRFLAARTGAVDSEEELADMDRVALLQVVAQSRAAQIEIEKSAAAVTKAPARSDRQIELELQLELKRLEADERRAEREIEMENKRVDMQMQMQREEREARLKEKELELQLEKQRGMTRTDRVAAEEVVEDNAGHDYYDSTSDGAADPRAGSHSRTRASLLADRVKKYGSALKQVLSPMGNDPTEIAQYFENYENICQTFEVPEDLQAKLLLPFLSQKARTLTSRLSPVELDDYEKLKDYLLTQFKQTPREYRLRFENASKRSDETFTLFAARLCNCLRYYLRSREIEDDFQSLCDLLVSDRLKTCLPHGMLNHVLSQEGDSWFKPERLAHLADTYASNHASVPSSKFVGNTNVSHRGLSQRRMDGTHRRSQRFQSNDQVCYRCRLSGHIARFCPRTNVNGSNSAVQSSNVGSPQTNRRKCFICQKPNHIAKDCPARQVPEAQVNSTDSETAQVNRISASTAHGDKVGSCLSQLTEATVSVDDSFFKSSCMFPYAEFPASDCLSSDIASINKVNVKLNPLQYVDVFVDNVPCRGLDDSGAQISIISQALFERLNPEVCGFIQLQGIVGRPVRSPLAKVTVKQREGDRSCNLADGISVMCGVAPLVGTGHDVVLSSDVVRDIQQLPVATVSNILVGNAVTGNVCDCKNECDAKGIHLDVDDDGIGDIANNVDVDDGSNSVQNIDNLLQTNESNVNDDLIIEQINDESLSCYWEMAKLNKGNFVIENGTLYHRDQVEGQRVCQLCVPICRRNSVMQLAHDSVFGGHLGERKTRERIRLSFYWPNLRQDVQQYIRTCTECQLRSRPTTLDRVPITPITRVDLPFQVLNMDCIGPIDPPSTQGHRYCLCIVDNCTRWPTVYVLKSLTARAVCDMTSSPTLV